METVRISDDTVARKDNIIAVRLVCTDKYYFRISTTEGSEYSNYFPSEEEAIEWLCKVLPEFGLKFKEGGERD